MAPSKRKLVKASEKQVSSKQSTTSQKQKTKQVTAKENPQATKRVVPDTPISVPVEKKSRSNVEEQAPVSTTTNIAPQQSHPAVFPARGPHHKVIGNKGHASAGRTGLYAVECDDKYVMEFDFNGIGARFDRKCFAMITGLNCGLGFDEKEVEIMSSLCMFYFLEMVLLGGDKKRLVRNDNFNIIQNDDRVVDIHGIWGFETIPIVATIGPRGKYHGSNWIPRMLAWSCPSILQYTKLATTIFDRKDPLSNMPVVPVWDPFTPIDPAERAALSAFIDDPSTTVHPGDYDALEKSSFQLILTSGSWLGDVEMDAALFYIRKRMINYPQMYDQRAIVTDCMFWSSIHARYIKNLKEQSKHRVGDEEEDELADTVDWEKEMKDSPFDMYALGTLPIGSKSWLDVDYVYVPVNNDNKHWLAAKRDTGGGEGHRYAVPYSDHFVLSNTGPRAARMRVLLPSFCGASDAVVLVDHFMRVTGPTSGGEGQSGIRYLHHCVSKADLRTRREGGVSRSPFLIILCGEDKPVCVHVIIIMSTRDTHLARAADITVATVIVLKHGTAVAKGPAVCESPSSFCGVSGTAILAGRAKMRSRVTDHFKVIRDRASARAPMSCY
ncbi:hypothetical protein FNV43_RR08805 [Rhamnella rubrinervis]|uniref:Ubiquitin-like protease family profile domain-containing protein n=1 Tax=Rhamnella rubrinervis TaxID=2594499 RepID=A0A8K0H9Y9_9ROSA|nr:hypothetical protein FNV43_RR08805 [Rhamnella rubrinervis]